MLPFLTGILMLSDSMHDNSKKNYAGNDLALLIPTKDRPEKMQNLLNSLAVQKVSCGRIIVIDGGRSIKDIVQDFSDRLPVEYYECKPPGQIRQRNMGIALIDERSSLVGSLDDDIVLEPQAVEEMISFWNKCEPETAGVSFNIVNTPLEHRSWFKTLLGLSASKQGRVLRSGMTTANYPVTTHLRTQWLCGGATVWKRQILEEFQHKEVNSRWAIGEDIIFSYPIGKKFPLYVCADAKVRHEHIFDYTSTSRHRFHGRTQAMWLFYFVESNIDLSRISFLRVLFLRIIGKFLIGILTRKKEYIEFAIGQIEGVTKGLYALMRGWDITVILTEDSNAGIKKK